MRSWESKGKYYQESFVEFGFCITCFQDDDDDLFSVKKTEPRKPKKVAKPLGDDDLFGDSGDIFSDIPSKPKEKKKKRSATAAPKEDIFADREAAGLHVVLFLFLLLFFLTAFVMHRWFVVQK